MLPLIPAVSSRVVGSVMVLDPRLVFSIQFGRSSSDHFRLTTHCQIADQSWFWRDSRACKLRPFSNWPQRLHAAVTRLQETQPVFSSSMMSKIFVTVLRGSAFIAQRSVMHCLSVLIFHWLLRFGIRLSCVHDWSDRTGKIGPLAIGLIMLDDTYRYTR
jgi:hypothetical protein